MPAAFCQCVMLAYCCHYFSSARVFDIFRCRHCLTMHCGHVDYGLMMRYAKERRLPARCGYVIRALARAGIRLPCLRPRHVSRCCLCFTLCCWRDDAAAVTLPRYATLRRATAIASRCCCRHAAPLTTRRRCLFYATMPPHEYKVYN